MVRGDIIAAVSAELERRAAADPHGARWGTALRWLQHMTTTQYEGYVALVEAAFAAGMATAVQASRDAAMSPQHEEGDP